VARKDTVSSSDALTGIPTGLMSPVYAHARSLLRLLFDPVGVCVCVSAHGKNTEKQVQYQALQPHVALCSCCFMFYSFLRPALRCTYVYVLLIHNVLIAKPTTSRCTYSFALLLHVALNAMPN
jgi:hypothetical protein